MVPITAEHENVKGVAGGDAYVQVHRWEIHSNHYELVVEQWRKDDDGKLSTEIKVVPFFLSVKVALLMANGRKGK